MSLLLPSRLAISGILSPATSPKEETLHFGYPGRDPKRPTMVICAFDHSYSVTAMGGNDPVGRRFEEAWQGIRHVARYSRGGCSVGLLSFDQPSLSDTPPAPIASALHRARLRARLRVPLDAAGSSTLTPALTIAESIATGNPDADTWFLPFSDFYLTDDDAPAVHRRLGDFPGHVLAVALGDPPQAYLNNPPVDTVHVTTDSPAGAVASALLTALTSSRPGNTITPPPFLHAPQEGTSNAHE